MAELFLSVVIPCYNESGRIEKGLSTIIDYLKQQSYQSEVVLVDDGSTDKTRILAQELLKNFPQHKLLVKPVNQGKGRAIKSGMLGACGKFILFTDIDLSTPIAQLENLLKSLELNDIAIGVRRHKQAHILKHQSHLREFFGACFTKICNLLATPGIADATCGFKLFKQKAARRIFAKSMLDKWAFDAEILFLARKYNFSIAQIPVTWANDERTKVHLFQDGLQAFVDLLRIRWWDLRGEYGY